MRLRPLRLRAERPAAPEPSGLSGPVRLDKRTKNLVKRLKPGDVAVIDHLDIDRVAAETLVERAPVVVVNAAQSISGRYPNAGPAVLVEAGIPLLDAVGPAVFELSEGTQVEVDPDGVVRLDGVEVASGEWLQPEDVRKRMDAAKDNLATALEDFTLNTLSYVRRTRPACATGMCSWWSAATTTRRTCPPCAATSRSSARPSSGSTGGPTPCSRSASSPTSSSGTWTR
jgi:uncharacterized membrane-anchored protein